jgi:multidrug efflux pump subunit AcrA (membrane-fusion protein)
MWTCEMLDWPNPRKQRVSVLAAIAVLTTNPVFAAPLDPVSCLIEPYQTVELSTPVAGILQEVAVDRGDLVTTGQVVARLDSRVETLQRDLARARSTDMTQIAGLEARVAFLTDQAARNADLAKRSALSATEAQKAEMEAELARQELERAKLDQARAVLELRISSLWRGWMSCGLRLSPPSPISPALPWVRR